MDPNPHRISRLNTKVDDYNQTQQKENEHTLKGKKYLLPVHCKNRLAKQNQMWEMLMKETEGDTEIEAITIHL